MNTTLPYAALIAVLCFNTSANSQDTNDKDIEVVEVYGSKPYNTWKEEWLESRDKVRNYLNDSIDNEDFKITCQRVSVPNSNIKQRTCSSGYDSRIRRKIYIDAFYLGAGGFFNAQSASSTGSTEISRKKEEHLAIIEKIYVEDENFREIYHNHLKLKERYQKAHAAKFGSLSQFSEKVKGKQENEQ
ncbi:hypothetical protein [Alteromonas sp.]|uniref:hypothetical protein n=1 Tax=Alteromonas sp. TaxID=232 RepID=UPI000B6D3BE6|nr:hypothetical protein [Alteromonas sp.]MAI38560.1 hypothetical protein [Alteromonas sp.]OUX85835.1 MAG: hypothetical protein CBB95_13165 [Alteromonas sp. TMED35]